MGRSHSLGTLLSPGQMDEHWIPKPSQCCILWVPWLSVSVAQALHLWISCSKVSWHSVQITHLILSLCNLPLVMFRLGLFSTLMWAAWKRQKTLATLSLYHTLSFHTRLSLLVARLVCNPGSTIQQSENWPGTSAHRREEQESRHCGRASDGIGTKRLSSMSPMLRIWIFIKSTWSNCEPVKFHPCQQSSLVIWVDDVEGIVYPLCTVYDVDLKTLNYTSL